MKALTIACALLMATISADARAKDPLFLTDVLEAGQVDGALDVHYVSFGYDASAQKFRLNLLVEEAQLRLGTGGGLQLGAALPYVSYTRCTGSIPCSGPGKAQNLEVFGRFRLFGLPNESFTLATELRWITDTRYSGGDGLIADLTAGWAAGTDVRGYVGYEGGFPRDRRAGDFHSLRLGAHVGSERVRFAPELLYRYYSATQFNEALHQYGGSVAVHFQLLPDTFISPDVGYARFSPLPPGGGATDEWLAGLTLTQRFGGKATSVAPAPVPAPASTAAAPPAPAAPAVPVIAPPPAPAAPPMPSFQAGQVVTLRASTQMLARPTPDGDLVRSLRAGTALTLRSEMRNEAGRWWYVDANGQRGWVHEAGL